MADQRKEKMKQPFTTGTAKIPLVMQLEETECGAACLAMILAYYGKWVPLEQVKRDSGVMRGGADTENILGAARNYGLWTDICRYEAEELRDRAVFPCIVRFGVGHFIVLAGIKGNKVYVNDPAQGRYVCSMEEFKEKFTGICMSFVPSENFEPGGRKKSMVQYAKKCMKGAGSAAAFVTLASVVLTLITIIRLGISSFLLDYMLAVENSQWLGALMVLMALLAVIQIVVAWIEAVCTIRINGKLAVVGETTYMWKVLQLPMEFFSQRKAGDIQQRKLTSSKLSGNLINLVVPLFINTLMMVFYLVVMIRYSVLLTIVGISAVLINLGVSQWISVKRANISRVLTRDSSRLASATVSGIEMIDTIKAGGAENGYFEKWSGYQASVNTQNIRLAKLNQYLGLLPGMIQQIANIAVLMLGVYLVSRGTFTIGMIMAFQGFLSSFTAPAAALTDVGKTMQEMQADMERIEDVMEYPVDFWHRPEKEGITNDTSQASGKENITNSTSQASGKENVTDGTSQASGKENVTDGAAHISGKEYGKLSGSLELKNVTFGYSPIGEPLINDFSMQLKQGSRVALVGASGCGKSTVAKLISGLYRPWTGEILFDGKPIEQIDHNVFTGSVAVVDQDIILFEDTIAENIRMWDKSIEDYEVILAARDAQIHDDIMLRDKGYQYKLNEGGTNLSGGQRQRLEIARVLAQDPTLVVLDEATSALDAKTEYDVVKSIKERGISCVVIAHRLSTIRDCDEIIVLAQGSVAERGTHEELMDKNGVYAHLVGGE